MTTEHVSVPRELLEELMWTWRIEAKGHAEKGNYVRCDLTHKHADDLKAILSRATPSDDNGEYWEVRFICCGRDDGNTILNSYEEADAIRELYTSGVGVNPHGYSEAHKHDGGHQRAAIVSRFSTSPKEPIAPRVVTPEMITAFQLAELEYGERMQRSGIVFEPALSVEAGLAAALESFATSLPAARVPDGWVIVPEGDTCLVEHPKWGRYVFHAAPQAERKE